MKINFNADLGGMMPDDMKNKYNIGADGRMQISPEMLAALGLEGAELNGDATYSAKELDLEQVGLKSLSYRPITSIEYENLPSESKTGTGHLVRPGFIFMAIALAMIGYTTIEITGVSKAAGIGPYLVLALCVVILLVTAFVRVNKGIKEDSVVFPGKVLFIKTRRNNGDRKRIHYFVSVAFYDEKKYVKDVPCDYYTVKRIKIDSKVFICNNRVFAAE